MASSSAARALNRLAGASAAVGVGGWLMSEALYNVDGGHAAVIWHRFAGGIQGYTVGEGTHFRIPFVTYPTIFDARMRPRVISSRTGTKDLQQVQISLRVLSSPNIDKLPDIMAHLDDRSNYGLKANVGGCFPDATLAIDTDIGAGNGSTWRQ